MDSEIVKSIYAAAQDELEQAQQTALRYKIAAAIQQRAALQQTQLAAQRELASIGDAIASLDTALTAASTGDSSAIDLWYAKRQEPDDGAKTMGRSIGGTNECYREPARGAAVSIDVHR